MLRFLSYRNEVSDVLFKNVLIEQKLYSKVGQIFYSFNTISLNKNQF
jgi:hypothetical protein